MIQANTDDASKFTEEIMLEKALISIIIPAHNEAKAIGKVIADIPKELADEIVVISNASSDGTAAKAKQAGATVLNEPKKGYGHACLTGIDYLKNRKVQPNVIVFLDADYSDCPREMDRLVKPIIKDDVDLVIGSRALGDCEKGAMTLQQIWGNRLAVWLLKLFYGYEFTDLGPFRAIKFEKLLALNMEDKNFGWTVEMQIKATQHRLSFTEVPVSYKRRIGSSKVSGTVKGTVMASYKILYTIFKYRDKRETADRRRETANGRRETANL